MDEFKLTKIGTYYGSENDIEYIAFSECILMYAKIKDKDYDDGFIYLRGSNSFVGNIQKGKAAGKGRALYFKQGEKEG